MRAAILLIFTLLTAQVARLDAGQHADSTCGVVFGDAKGASLAPNPFPGVVPGGGLSEEDFADGGLLIEVDPTMYLVSDDPVGVISRAARNWEIPGTRIKFRVGGSGSNGNLMKAEPVRQQAYATIGKPGLGASSALKMTIRTPFHDGDDRLESIITHELGHWLGFDHSFLMETVMSPILNDRINWVDPDQVAKAVVRYGVAESSLGTVTGRITRKGQALSGARINLLGEENRTAFGTFSATDGTYSLPVYSGKYRMYIDPNDGPAVKGNFFGTYPGGPLVGSSRVDLQACKLEYSIVSPK